jgi:hypothetical protein
MSLVQVAMKRSREPAHNQVGDIGIEIEKSAAFLGQHAPIILKYPMVSYKPKFSGVVFRERVVLLACVPYEGSLITIRHVLGCCLPVR